MSFLVRHTSGFLRVPVAAEICEVLELPQMVRHNENAYGAAYTVSVDARSGVSTGISARDRCRTVRVLADASARPDDLTRPGHVVPVRSQPGGLLTRIGFAEAAVDLAVLAGQRPAAVMSELVGSRDEHVLPAIDEVASFAAEHRLAMISLSELVAHCGKARPLALEGMSG
jgi:3,4-dihydroxy 2-butanone 4-phosphate synthase/GTP cyclohydrolase II